MIQFKLNTFEVNNKLLETNMFPKFKFILILCFTQIILATAIRSVNEVAQNYEEIIHKMVDQVKNFTDYTYKNCSLQVVMVLNNNTMELIETKDSIREMHSGKDVVLAESGMAFFPQMTKECLENFNEESEELSRKISNAENVCLMFISNVFTLVENPALYKNITDLQLVVEQIQPNCTDATSVREAEDCFKREIYSVSQPRIREMRRNVHLFLTTVDRKVRQMTDTLHSCYSTIRTEVLQKKVRQGVRNFQKCLQRKNVSS